MKIFSAKNNVSEIGEKKLIAEICARFGNSMPRAPFGAGDDCALILKKSLKKNIYATSDAVILGVHFAPDTPPELIAEKLAKRNVSDIASMGARPVYALTSCILSKNLSLKWLDAFSTGLSKAACKYNFKLVGGDIAAVASDFFSMHMTLIGHSSIEPLLRSGALAGDTLYVSGALGFSFESDRHLSFAPRIDEGEFLAKWNLGKSSGRISSCTDISDGLASDIQNVLAENCAAEIDEKKLPRNIWNGETASLKRAMCDGEDYELLFAFRGDIKERSAFEKAYAMRFGSAPFAIGRVLKKTPRSGGGVILNNADGSKEIFKGSGFEHGL